MIENIIEFSIRNRFVVILVWLGVAAWGIHAVINTPIDAIPDLSENQVIVFTDWMGRSPREIEDQITYPLSVSLQGLAGVKAVRSSSEFNFSMINVIFEDNVDFYFARDRGFGAAARWRTPSCRRASSPTWPPRPRPWARSSGTPSRARARTWAGSARSRISTSSIALKSVRGRGRRGLGRRDADRVPDRRRSVQAPRLQRHAGRALCGRRPRQFVRWRQGDPAGRGRVHRPRRRLDREPPRHRADRRQDRCAKRHADHRRPAWHGRPRRRVPPQRAGEKRLAKRSARSSSCGKARTRLHVTKRIKAKIEELQPGLPEGIRIVPFYDRTRLIHGAIEIGHLDAPRRDDHRLDRHLADSHALPQRTC